MSAQEEKRSWYVLDQQGQRVVRNGGVDGPTPPTIDDCFRAARRLARLSGWDGREVFPISTWAEIIAGELGIEREESDADQQEEV